MAIQRFWWRESLLSALSLACNVSRGGREFQPLPGAILIIVFTLVISSGSAFADGKADAVAAVNWFLDKLGCDTLGKALIIDEFLPHQWHGPTACTIGGRY